MKKQTKENKERKFQVPCLHTALGSHGSDKTKKLYHTLGCNIAILSQQVELLSTIGTLAYLANCTPSQDEFLNFQESITQQKVLKRVKRVSPVALVNLKAMSKTKLIYRNTLHRYPWICSLRTISQPPEHLCAVTLLSLHPRVIVGPAHCAYVCKDGGQFGERLPSCCCTTGRPSSCSSDIVQCGTTPMVADMLARDADILCGEWQTGATLREVSGELYNVRVQILQILKHPGFDASQGPIGGNDIAVFKTADKVVGNSEMLKAACFPSPSTERAAFGVHSGWANAPKIHWLEKNGPALMESYSDFFKQWHYRMEIQGKCQDSRVSPVLLKPLVYESESYYPPGTICAKDIFRKACFSTGESGSPLMVQSNHSKKRLHVEALQSFVKGCDIFFLGRVISTFQGFNVHNESPSIYTKLSCFLPWVASQYGLSFRPDLDRRCKEGTGSRRIATECRTNPQIPFAFGATQSANLGEDKCIFPFIYREKMYRECMVSPTADFVFQVVCPTVRSTSRINGTDNYGDRAIVLGYCLNDNKEADLESYDCTSGPRQVFSQCKNNCPGARGFGIVGGGSLVVAASSTSGLRHLNISPNTGVLKLFGLAKARLESSYLCDPPFCRASSGNCCLLIASNRGVVCPYSC